MKLLGKTAKVIVQPWRVEKEQVVDLSGRALLKVLDGPAGALAAAAPKMLIALEEVVAELKVLTKILNKEGYMWINEDTTLRFAESAVRAATGGNCSGGGPY